MESVIYQIAATLVKGKARIQFGASKVVLYNQTGISWHSPNYCKHIYQYASLFVLECESTRSLFQVYINLFSSIVKQALLANVNHAW